MKIKCVQAKCEICGKLASIQVFYNKRGTAKYARARHYVGRENGKPKFEYHQQSLEYIQVEISKIPKVNPTNTLEIGHVGQRMDIDLEKLEINL